MLQRKTTSSIVRGQSHHGDGDRLRQVYREAFLQHKNNEIEQKNNESRSKQTDIDIEVQVIIEEETSENELH